VLAHLRVGVPEQAAPHTNRAPRAEHGSNCQGLPRGVDAISKAGVRRPDTGRVARHVSNHADEVDETIAFVDRALDVSDVVSATLNRFAPVHAGRSERPD
jgi:hypothetical protein